MSKQIELGIGQELGVTDRYFLVYCGAGHFSVYIDRSYATCFLYSLRVTSDSDFWVEKHHYKLLSQAFHPEKVTIIEVDVT